MAVAAANREALDRVLADPTFELIPLKNVRDQAAALPRNDRIDEEPVLVDESEPDQLVNEGNAARSNDVLAGAALQRREHHGSRLDLHGALDAQHRFASHASLTAGDLVIAGAGTEMQWSVLLSERIEP